MKIAMNVDTEKLASITKLKNRAMKPKTDAKSTPVYFRVTFSIKFGLIDLICCSNAQIFSS